MNLKRRHLDATQRSAIAAELENMPLGGAMYRYANLHTDIAPVSRTEAATLLNVSRRSVATAAFRHGVAG
jgi:hypothetical protein